MSAQTTKPARNTKVMNRFDITSRLVAKLKNEEAVIGGIGNTNFDLWAAAIARRTGTCWAAWGSPSRLRSAWRWRSRSDGCSRWKAMVRY
jgi:hypothetical protein